MLRWISLSGQLLIAIFIFGYCLLRPFLPNNFETLKFGASIFVFFKILQRLQGAKNLSFAAYFYVISISFLLIPYTGFLNTLISKIGPELLSRLGAAMLLIESVILFTLGIRKKK